MLDPSGGLRQRALALFGAAALVAGLTGWSAYRVIAGYQQELVAARQPGKQMRVLAAVRDLPAGQVLSERDVVPLTLPDDPALAEKTFAAAEEVVGKVVRSPILAGEPIRRQRFGTELSKSSLALEIAPGMRAVTVEVTRAAGVDGRLERGDHVDVIATVHPEENALQATWVTGTILQGIRVLDTGAPPDDTIGAPGATPPSLSTPEQRVTLELEPDEAEKLAMASARGRIHLALRGRDDLDVVDHAGPLVTNTMVGLTGPPTETRIRRLSAERATRTAEPSLTSAEVIQGNTLTQEQFDPDGRRIPTLR